jgi:hypothetical protein
MNPAGGMSSMQRDIAAKQPPVTPGVIDSIADGLSLALARPLLLLLPMLLDLYYWAGWRVSVEALTSPIRRWLLDVDTSESADLAGRLETAGRSDIMSLLSLLVPSLLSGVKRDEFYTFRSRPLFVPDAWWLDVLLLGAVGIGATLLMMIYSVPLADAALDRSRKLSAVLLAIGWAWIRFVGLLAVATGVLLLLLGPVLVASAVLLFVGVDASPLIGLAMLAVGLFAYLILVMAWDAIVVSEVGPLTAIYNSYAVVRAHFWPTVGLVGAWLLIVVGLGEVWLKIAGTAPGLLIGVIANAFFASGLAMASMLFYAGRIQALKPERTR